MFLFLLIAGVVILIVAGSKTAAPAAPPAFATLGPGPGASAATTKAYAQTPAKWNSVPPKVKMDPAHGNEYAFVNTSVPPLNDPIECQSPMEWKYIRWINDIDSRVYRPGLGDEMPSDIGELTEEGTGRWISGGANWHVDPAQVAVAPLYALRLATILLAAGTEGHTMKGWWDLTFQGKAPKLQIGHGIFWPQIYNKAIRALQNDVPLDFGMEQEYATIIAFQATLFRSGMLSKT